MKNTHNYFILKDYLYLLIGVLSSIFLIINQNKDFETYFKSWSLVIFDTVLPDFYNPLKIAQIKSENIYLKTALLKEELKSNEYFDLRQENKNLREMVQLQERTNYSYVYARVLARNPEKYPFTLLINIGLKNGISVGDIAVTPKGLVGLVTECSKDYARISMICSPKNKIAVRSQNDRVPGILHPLNDEYAEIKEITKSQNLVKGENILTSSFSTIYPDGFLIGKISTVSDSAATIHKELKLKYAVNFTVLEDLFVIKKEQNKKIEPDIK